MRDSKYYMCEYCSSEYIPKRRRVQKYCSNSCRSNARQIRNRKKSIVINKDINQEINVPVEISKIQKDKISYVGVGNAAAGSLLADGLKSILTANLNKPATKGDIIVIVDKLQGRFHLISNLQKDIYGRHAYFDLLEGKIVYLN